MNNDNFDFMLFDRIEKIKQIDKEYNLQENAYISFSGGKDSTVLSYLVDLALPGNKIPRVFINTGIEYLEIVKFVKEQALNDDRIQIFASNTNIRKMLKENGYPFKSKEHSQYVALFQKNGYSKTTERYLHPSESRKAFGCLEKLKYQFTDKCDLKISDRCCWELKKYPVHRWMKENGRSITITGMRKGEGGNRRNLNCIVTDKDELVKFHPLAPVSEEFMDELVKAGNIKLCKLYYEPYNFSRTGCLGCPYNKDLERDLKTLKELLPNEYKRANLLWKPVYDEYRRINFRLKDSKAIDIWDVIKND